MVSGLSSPSTITILWLAGRSRRVRTSPLGHSILTCRIPSWLPRPNQTRRELWDRKPDPILTNFDLEPASVSMVIFAPTASLLLRVPLRSKLAAL